MKYSTFIEEKISALKNSGQYRTFQTINRINGSYPEAYTDDDEQKKVVVWCSNDYLNMSQNPQVIESMHKAIEQYGAGSGGSRNIGGTHSCFEKLESAIADWHGKEAALVFPTGYSSNDTTIQCLLKLFDVWSVFLQTLTGGPTSTHLRAWITYAAVFILPLSVLLRDTHNQFFFPRQTERRARSAALLSISASPSSQK